MSIGITEDHRALAESVKGWAERNGLRAAARAVAEGGSDTCDWAGFAAQGLLGLAIDEEYGGSGATLVELAIAVEEIARTLGPPSYLPTVITSLVISRLAPPDLAKTWLPRLVDGSARASIELTQGAGALGAVQADLVLMATDDGWVALEAGEVEALPGALLDPTRGIDTVVAKAPGVSIAATAEQVWDLAATLVAAEAAGVAGWALDTTVAYVKLREQFGRPLGSFQAVKHMCADMLIAVEKARASAWDAARAIDDETFALAAAVGAHTAVDAAVYCTKSAVQLHGGIGYTWEHDAHLYFKRAQGLRVLLGGGKVAPMRVADLAVGGMVRPLGIHLGSEVDGLRAELRSIFDEIRELDAPTQRRRLAAEGLVTPHWPAPYGRGASPSEQLAIEEEFQSAGIVQPNLVIGNWAAPTILAAGTPEQAKRFVGPTIAGDIAWCQMFSEPGAGSDLANLSTKATKVDGGWLLNGQKVWTSMARTADWAICLVRTDSEAVPKHKGITFLLLDMSSPGLDIRPLREMTGEEFFNEIFLNDVFVPDDCIVGEVNDGWRLTVISLANERVAMGGGLTVGKGSRAIIDTLRTHPSLAGERVTQFKAGELLARGAADELLGLRTTLRRLAGTDPGPGASLRKLSHVIQVQDCAEFVLDLLGPGGGTEAAEAMHEVLKSRQLTIAGGASEVQRNIIAERILGLPREK